MRCTSDNVIHVPQLRTDILYHLDAVARVEGPTIETIHRIALAVSILQLIIELEAANGHDDALASLDGVLRTVVANVGVAPTISLVRGSESRFRRDS